MIGQQYLQQQIRNAIENRSLARFIILVGDTGSGRKTLAKEIARLVDAQYIVVDKGVDAIREIIEKSYALSGEMVYVIDGDNISHAGKSALLKVTEEPPNKARFILTTTNAEKTLDTLISRACVYKMDNYTAEDIAYFAGSEDWRYPNFCSNKYEVDLLKGYGIDEFAQYVDKVVSNIDVVSSANVFKIEHSLSFKEDDGKYDVKIFLQAFRTECIDRVQQFDEYPQKMKYLDWVGITTETISTLRISSLNKQALIDKWIFDIRGVSYAEGNQG